MHTKSVNVMKNANICCHQTTKIRSFIFPKGTNPKRGKNANKNMPTRGTSKRNFSEWIKNNKDRQMNKIE
jgi:hypothetical protein